MIQQTIDELRALKEHLENIAEMYGINQSERIFTLDKAIIMCERCRRYRKKAKRWKWKYLELREKCYPRERRFTMPADVPLEQMNEMLNGLVTIRKGTE